MKKVYHLLITIIAAIKTLPALKQIKKMANESPKIKKEIVLRTTKRFGEEVINNLNVKLIIEGIENCSTTKTALFVSNHQSAYDIPLLLKVIPKQVGFVAKKELTKVPIVNQWITQMNGVYLDRKNRRQSLQAIKEGVVKLKEGHSLVIFPEGTRSNSNQMKGFKIGSLTLAAKANVPIIPIAIEGTYNIGVEKTPDVSVTFFEPIYLKEKEDQNKVSQNIEKKIKDDITIRKEYVKTIAKMR